MNGPTASCLMVTRPGRLEAVRAAVADFSGQSYAPKELVIVVDDADYASQVDRAVRDHQESIYLVRVSPKLSLGELRNVALNSCHGEYACQWDDDDRYSPDRLALQMEPLRAGKINACFLFQQLYFFENQRELFWTDWRYRDGRGVRSGLNVIPGTVMCKRGIAFYPEQGERATRGEDTVFASKLFPAGAIGIETPPGTYFRTYHGANPWDWPHHRENAVRKSRSLDAIRANRSAILDALAHFEIASPVTVMAGNRVVFRI